MHKCHSNNYSCQQNIIFHRETSIPYAGILMWVVRTGLYEIKNKSMMCGTMEVEWVYQLLINWNGNPKQTLEAKSAVKLYTACAKRSG